MLATADGIEAAQAFARTRPGIVSFAVLDTRGQLRGLNRTRRYPSASVVKAMLLVARLRQLESHELGRGDRALLSPMIERSDNTAAQIVHGLVGDAGLHRVATAAGMHKLSTAAGLFDTQITAADRARLFLQIDALVPQRHREYARTLLRSIVPEQRWGMPPVARRHKMRIYFKGGWRSGITHQVALLTRGEERIAIAVLTRGESMATGERTIEGIAKRVLQ